MTNHYDVIVAGAGPAGALTAYRLAKAGVRTLILDARSFPRDKTCGGGLQHRASLEIPFDWRAALRSELNSVCFSYRCRSRFTKSYPCTLVYGILRHEFDAMLLYAARDAGADVIENCTVRSVSSGGVVDTTKASFHGRFVVGADGANSVVRQFVNKRTGYYWQAALSCEVPEQCFRRHVDPNTMRIDWGAMAGYAWIFPKRGFANIGVGGPVPVARDLRAYLARFLETEKILKPGAEAALTFRGHQLPTLRRGTPLSRANVLLVGDAAGLVDPLSGDGISGGVHSARIAAETLIEALANGRENLAQYDTRIQHEIADELFWSRRMLSFLLAFPWVIHEAARRSDRVWNAFCSVMRGDESLLVFRRKFLPARLALRWVERLAMRREQGILESGQARRTARS